MNQLQRPQLDEEQLEKHKEKLDAALRRDGSVRLLGRTANDLQSYKP